MDDQERQVINLLGNDSGNSMHLFSPAWHLSRFLFPWSKAQILKYGNIDKCGSAGCRSYLSYNKGSYQAQLLSLNYIEGMQWLGDLISKIKKWVYKFRLRTHKYFSLWDNNIPISPLDVNFFTNQCSYSLVPTFSIYEGQYLVTIFFTI